MTVRLPVVVLCFDLLEIVVSAGSYSPSGSNEKSIVVP